MIEILDNFLPNELEDVIEQLHFGEYFPWYLGSIKNSVNNI